MTTSAPGSTTGPSRRTSSTHPPLRPRAWELRANVSFYDGLYVALAEVTGNPLVTADARLAAAHGPRCTIDLV